MKHKLIIGAATLQLLICSTNVSAEIKELQSECKRFAQEVKAQALNLATDDGAVSDGYNTFNNNTNAKTEMMAQVMVNGLKMRPNQVEFYADSYCFLLNYKARFNQT